MTDNNSNDPKPDVVTIRVQRHAGDLYASKVAGHEYGQPEQPKLADTIKHYQQQGYDLLDDYTDDTKSGTMLTLQRKQVSERDALLDAIGRPEKPAPPTTADKLNAIPLTKQNFTVKLMRGVDGTWEVDSIGSKKFAPDERPAYADLWENFLIRGFVPENEPEQGKSYPAGFLMRFASTTGKVEQHTETEADQAARAQIARVMKF